MKLGIMLLFGFASSSLLDRFENWATKFKVQLKQRDTAEYTKLFQKWTENHNYIEEINSKNLTYTLGHNQFSAMDESDFRLYLGLSRILFLDYKNQYQTVDSTTNNVIVAAAQSINWVTKGGVTPVKDQGQCGSCWSFSTTGAIEGAYFVKTGILESFSEQQLVDCDNHNNGGKDFGCNGGLMDNAFTWVSKNGGLCKEKDYPYVSGTTKKTEICQTTCSLVGKSEVSSFVDVPPSSDESMMSALSKQPVSIAIQADQKDFQLYKSGVFTGKCGTDLDHGVLVVGYGTLDGEDYYIVKNSWSVNWGQDGYILLGRGAKYNGGSGQCGMLLQGSYPIMGTHLRSN
jgi:xylem cysteine proteinase